MPLMEMFGFVSRTGALQVPVEALWRASTWPLTGILRERSTFVQSGDTVLVVGSRS